MKTVGLFAGIGGIELGLGRAGHESTLLCEIDPAARSVLADRFQSVPVAEDVRALKTLPAGTELVAAGFPCTNLSQAGGTAGITGDQSSLVGEVFRLLRPRRLPDWVLFENVPFMLQLDRGQAMHVIVRELEDRGMRWAYRVVDARAFGLPQRRRRVVLLASSRHDPTEVLFADDAGPRPPDDYRCDAFGFYWTEGNRGLGWAQDAIPTLKGGSALGIPSPPGIWVPEQGVGRKVLTPGLTDAEALQGFPRGWTSAAASGSDRRRWKLVGNAVPVPIARWVGRRLATPGHPLGVAQSTSGWPSSWPTAASGERGARWEVALSEFPVHDRYRHLLEVVDAAKAPALGQRAAGGFYSRASVARLRISPDFLADVHGHVDAIGRAASTAVQ